MRVLIRSGSVLAAGSGRMWCVLITLAGCLALQGCAALDEETRFEVVQGEVDPAPQVPPGNETPGRVEAVPPVPIPIPAPAAPPAPVSKVQIAPASAVAKGSAPKPAPAAPPAAVPEQRWETLPLSLLQKEASPDYRLAPEDVLGVWIGGVLGELNQPPPMPVAKAGAKPSGVGFPVPVRADGTIVLPLVAPIQVGKLTLEEAEEVIRHAYTVGKQILKPGRERIVVTLMRQRECQVTVIRQDLSAGAGATNRDGPGAVQAIRLPATENDVLHALALTGGYPRPEVASEIVIERPSASGERLPGPPVTASLASMAEGVPGGDPRVCITLNYPSNYRPLIRPQDVVLHSGDIMVVRPIRLTGPALAAK